jgi:xanthine dehydrogenase accessory factor
LREVRRRAGDSFVLATVVRTAGSSYRRPGACMLICQDGMTIGSLSGGCLEEEVAASARDVLRAGRSVTLHFDTRKRFGCNGQIEVLVERVPPGLFARIAGQIEERSDCKIVRGENDEFAHVVRPPIRLFLFGDGPDSSPLRSLARVLGWETIDVLDGAACEITPDDRTIAVVKTHNYARDFAALRLLLPLALPYVGLIGPRRRRDQLLSDLLDVGVVINAGFYAPAGIDLAAETPEEIALSITAEIQRVLGHGSGVSLRERKAPIHAKPEAAPEPCRASLR